MLDRPSAWLWYEPGPLGSKTKHIVGSLERLDKDYAANFQPLYLQQEQYECNCNREWQTIVSLIAVALSLAAICLLLFGMFISNVP
jgi:hypothetical protein